MEMENIGYYLKFCWHLGLQSSDLFITSDLYERKGEGEVVRNLLALARHCQARHGWKGPLLASLPPPPRVSLAPSEAAVAAKPKHWELPGPRPPVYVADAPGDAHAELVRRLEAEVAALRAELSKARARAGVHDATPNSTVSSVAPAPAPAAAPAYAAQQARGAEERAARAEAERDAAVARERAAVARAASLEAEVQRLAAAGAEAEEGAELLITSLDRLLVNEAVASEEMVELNAYFKSERGRRHFAKQLKRTLKRVPSLVLCDASFETLLWLFNTVLALQQASAAPDFIAARMLMAASSSIARRGADGGFEYLRDHIRAYDLWHVEAFWQELLYAELAVNYREAMAAEVDAFTQSVVPSLALTIAYSMLFDWLVPPALVRTFVGHVMERNAIAPAAAAAALDEVREYAAAVGKEGTERFRALQARLAKKEEDQEREVKRLLSRGSSSGMLSRSSNPGARPHEHTLVARPRTAVTVKCHKCHKHIWGHAQKALLCTECGFSVRPSRAARAPHAPRRSTAPAGSDAAPFNLTLLVQYTRGAASHDAPVVDVPLGRARRGRGGVEAPRAVHEELVQVQPRRQRRRHRPVLRRARRGGQRQRHGRPRAPRAGHGDGALGAARPAELGAHAVHGGRQAPVQQRGGPAGRRERGLVGIVRPGKVHEEAERDAPRRHEQRGGVHAERGAERQGQERALLVERGGDEHGARRPPRPVQPQQHGRVGGAQRRVGGLRVRRYAHRLGHALGGRVRAAQLERHGRHDGGRRRDRGRRGGGRGGGGGARGGAARGRRGGGRLVVVR